VPPAAALDVRVSVPDVWDVVPIRAAPDWTVERLKREALAAATGRSLDAAAYLVKFRGARVLDEAATLASLGASDRAAFIVLPAHRRPVR
jgi:hypothetical protein